MRYEKVRPQPIWKLVNDWRNLARPIECLAVLDKLSSSLAGLQDGRPRSRADRPSREMNEDLFSTIY